MATSQMSANFVRNPSDSLRFTPSTLASKSNGGRLSSLPLRRVLTVRASITVASKFKTCKPLGDRVLVKIKQAEEKTRGGIRLSSSAQNKLECGPFRNGKTVGKSKLQLDVQGPREAVSIERNLVTTNIELEVSNVRSMEFTMTQPDDWHLHLRDGDVLESVISHSSTTFRRAMVMPNLKPPVTTVAAAVAYQERILKALPSDSKFIPLMTLYLTDNMNHTEIKLAKESGVIFGVKLYPSGATTNSQDGVTDLFGKCIPVLQEMMECGMPLLVHGEVTDPNIDVFDREKVFIDTILKPLVKQLPRLKIVMEHITTIDAVNFVESCVEGLVAATVTPQHLLLNRNALFQGGLQPHNYCLPLLKQECHRQAVVSAVTSGSKRFFLGTDSAPHEKHQKERSCGCAGIYSAPIALPLYAKVFEQVGALDKLEAFASFNGPDFYGLPRNTSEITLQKVSWKVPEEYKFNFGTIVPMFSGQILDWCISD